MVKEARLGRALFESKCVSVQSTCSLVPTKLREVLLRSPAIRTNQQWHSPTWNLLEMRSIVLENRDIELHTEARLIRSQIPVASSIGSTRKVTWNCHRIALPHWQDYSVLLMILLSFF